VLFVLVDNDKAYHLPALRVMIIAFPVAVGEYMLFVLVDNDKAYHLPALRVMIIAFPVAVGEYILCRNCIYL